MKITDKILFTADSIPLMNDIPNYDNYFDLMKSLSIIRSDKGYKTLLTSWTPALMNRSDIDRIISEGKGYMERIDASVREHYSNEKEDMMSCCRKTVDKLGLPLFLVNPLVNRAFLSHLI